MKEHRSTGRGREGARRWTAVGMAFCAVAMAGRAPSVWDDPAFALYRQAVEAVDRKEYAEARRLATAAIRLYPDLVLAHYVLGQAAIGEERWDEATAAFSRVTALYPGSFAARRELAVLEQYRAADRSPPTSP